MVEEADSWLTVVREITHRLVRLRAVSPSRDEAEVARAVYAMLCADGCAAAYQVSGLDALTDDPYERHNVFALVRGRRPETLVLLGHCDTVGTDDYGPLAPWATDPAGLAQRVDALEALDPDLRADLAAHPDDWLFGRGSVDMKAGVAVHIALMRRLAAAAAAGAPPGVSVLFLATPDEEHESAGALHAVRLLLRLRREHGLHYIGVLNTDYSTAEYPGDAQRYVYNGTIGKLLPTVLAIGQESHVGQPFDGLDANLLAAELIREVSMDEDLCDRVNGQVAPPPVTLRAADLKARYDVQLPFAAYFCLNVLTLETDPTALLERVRRRAEVALRRTLERVDATEARWNAAAGRPARAAGPRVGLVLMYDELRGRAIARLGAEQVALQLAAGASQWPADLDTRERCARLAQWLWTLSGLRGPAFVLLYAPPYYPHVPAMPGLLQDAVRQVIAAHPEHALVERGMYPYVSDLSYVGLAASVDTTGLTANMPIWHESDVAPPAAAYALPLASMRELALPVVNFGPYGRGAHRAGERVLMSYSFDALPRLLWEVIERVGAQVVQGTPPQSEMPEGQLHGG